MPFVKFSYKNTKPNTTKQSRNGVSKNALHRQQLCQINKHNEYLLRLVTPQNTRNMLYDHQRSRLFPDIAVLRQFPHLISQQPRRSSSSIQSPERDEPTTSQQFVNHQQNDAQQQQQQQHEENHNTADLILRVTSQHLPTPVIGRYGVGESNSNMTPSAITNVNTPIISNVPTMDNTNIDDDRGITTPHDGLNTNYPSLQSNTSHDNNQITKHNNNNKNLEHPPRNQLHIQFYGETDVKSAGTEYDIDEISTTITTTAAPITTTKTMNQKGSSSSSVIMIEKIKIDTLIPTASTTIPHSQSANQGGDDISNAPTQTTILSEEITADNSNDNNTNNEKDQPQTPQSTTLPIHMNDNEENKIVVDNNNNNNNLLEQHQQTNNNNNSSLDPDVLRENEILYDLTPNSTQLHQRTLSKQHIYRHKSLKQILYHTSAVLEGEELNTQQQQQYSDNNNNNNNNNNNGCDTPLHNAVHAPSTLSPPATPLTTYTVTTGLNNNNFKNFSLYDDANQNNGDFSETLTVDTTQTATPFPNTMCSHFIQKSQQQQQQDNNNITINQTNIMDEQQQQQQQQQDKTAPNTPYPTTNYHIHHRRDDDHNKTQNNTPRKPSKVTTTTTTLLLSKRTNTITDENNNNKVEPSKNILNHPILPNQNTTSTFLLDTNSIYTLQTNIETATTYSQQHDDLNTTVTGGGGLGGGGGQNYFYLEVDPDDLKSHYTNFDISIQNSPEFGPVLSAHNDHVGMGVMTMMGGLDKSNLILDDTMAGKITTTPPTTTTTRQTIINNNNKNGNNILQKPNDIQPIVIHQVNNAQQEEEQKQQNYATVSPSRTTTTTTTTNHKLLQNMNSNNTQYDDLDTTAIETVESNTLPTNCTTTNRFSHDTATISYHATPTRQNDINNMDTNINNNSNNNNHSNNNNNNNYYSTSVLNSKSNSPTKAQQFIHNLYQNHNSNITPTKANNNSNNNNNNTSNNNNDVNISTSPTHGNIPGNIHIPTSPRRDNNNNNNSGSSQSSGNLLLSPQHYIPNNTSNDDMSMTFAHFKKNTSRRFDDPDLQLYTKNKNRQQLQQQHQQQYMNEDETSSSSNTHNHHHHIGKINNVTIPDVLPEEDDQDEVIIIPNHIGIDGIERNDDEQHDLILEEDNFIVNKNLNHNNNNKSIQNKNTIIRQKDINQSYYKDMSGEIHDDCFDEKDQRKSNQNNNNNNAHTSQQQHNFDRPTTITNTPTVHHKNKQSISFHQNDDVGIGITTIVEEEIDIELHVQSHNDNDNDDDDDFVHIELNDIPHDYNQQVNNTSHQNDKINYTNDNIPDANQTIIQKGQVDPVQSCGGSSDDNNTSIRMVAEQTEELCNNTNNNNNSNNDDNHNKQNQENLVEVETAMSDVVVSKKNTMNDDEEIDITPEDDTTQRQQKQQQQQQSNTPEQEQTTNTGQEEEEEDTKIVCFTLDQITKLKEFILPDSVLIFDIDDTLITTPENCRSQLLSTPDGIKFFNKTLIEDYDNISYDYRTYLLKQCNNIKRITTLSEHDLVEFLSMVYNKIPNVTILCLTARDESLATTTKQTLKQFQLAFNQYAPLGLQNGRFSIENIPENVLPYYDNNISAIQNMSYFICDGIVYSNGFDKGVVLFDILQRGMFHNKKLLKTNSLSSTTAVTSGLATKNNNNNNNNNKRKSNKNGGGNNNNHNNIMINNNNNIVTHDDDKQQEKHITKIKQLWVIDDQIAIIQQLNNVFNHHYAKNALKQSHYHIPVIVCCHYLRNVERTQNHNLSINKRLNELNQLYQQLAIRLGMTGNNNNNNNGGSGGESNNLINDATSVTSGNNNTHENNSYRSKNHNHHQIKDLTMGSLYDLQLYFWIVNYLQQFIYSTNHNNNNNNNGGGGGELPITKVKNKTKFAFGKYLPYFNKYIQHHHNKHTHHHSAASVHSSSRRRGSTLSTTNTHDNNHNNNHTTNNNNNNNNSNNQDYITSLDRFKQHFSNGVLPDEVGLEMLYNLYVAPLVAKYNETQGQKGPELSYSLNTFPL